MPGWDGNAGIQFTVSFLSFSFPGRGSDCLEKAAWIRGLKGCQWKLTFAGNLGTETFVSLLAKPHPVERGLFRLDQFL